MRGDSKNDLYMSWSSDGASASSTCSTPLPHVSKGSSSDDVVVGDIIAPESPSETPSSPAQLDFYTYSRDDEEHAPVAELEKGEERKPSPWRWAIIIILLIGVGVVLYMVFGSKVLGTNDASNPAGNMTTAIPSAAPTTKPDTNMPSLTPTAAPAFEPPSVEDCIAIARGEAVEGQDQMMVERYEVVLDVALDSGGLEIQGILNRLVAEIRQIVLPEILGCGDANRKLMEIESGTEDHPSASRAIISMIRGGAKRQLTWTSSSSPSARYIMANAVISIRNPSGEWCAAGSGPLCYRVIVSLDMAFKSDDLKVLTVVQYIAEAFKTADSLADKLLLGSPFQKIFVRDVYPAFHTAIPTLSPSHI